MRYWQRAGSTAVAVLALVGAILVAPRDADAHGRGGWGGHRVVYGGGFYGYNPWFGFGPYWGWGWGPYPPAFYAPPGGIDMGAAMVAGFGAIELNVKPNRADVWVDGRYVGEARDLDGYPSYLWLAEGPHKVAVHKGGFQVFEEEIDVQRGMKKEIKLKLQPGDSPPPGAKPTSKVSVEKKQ
jgi:hypothetical protein